MDHLTSCRILQGAVLTQQQRQEDKVSNLRKHSTYNQNNKGTFGTYFWAFTTFTVVERVNTKNILVSAAGKAMDCSYETLQLVVRQDDDGPQKRPTTLPRKPLGDLVRLLR
jgi:hypothetical protein